jgi:glycine cleavage system H protein
MVGPIWHGCEVPEDLLYDVDANVWVRVDGDTVVMGMTDIGQTMCGRFVQISWKSPGRTIARGRSLAVIESAKWVGPFPAAVTGELVANNESAFAADIAAANRDPYGEGWLVRVRPADFAAERETLVDGAEAMVRYRPFIEENDVRCYRCED